MPLEITSTFCNDNVFLCPVSDFVGVGGVWDEIRNNLLSLHYTATPYLKVESNFLHMPKHVFEFCPFFFAESFISHSREGIQNSRADNEKLSQYD